MTTRCAWAGADPLMQAYHDTEWGVPERDSRALWEKLVLDGFQAGLAWITILRKRDTLRAAFAGFDPAAVARFRETDVERLLQDPGIIRSRAKVQAAIDSARIYCAMADRGEDFSAWAWSFTDGQVLHGDGVSVPGQHRTLGAHLEGPQAPRLQVRRPHHRLRLDAGDGHRERPRGPLLPPRRGLSRPAGTVMQARTYQGSCTAARSAFEADIDLDPSQLHTGMKPIEQARGPAHGRGEP